MSCDYSYMPLYYPRNERKKYHDKGILAEGLARLFRDNV